MEELRNKAESKVEEAKKTPAVGGTETAENNVTKSRASTASSEQDLDTFLLGDLEDSDEGAGETLNLLLPHVLNLSSEIDFFVYRITLQMMVMVMVMEA